MRENSRKGHGQRNVPQRVVRAHLQPPADELRFALVHPEDEGQEHETGEGEATDGRDGRVQRVVEDFHAAKVGPVKRGYDQQNEPAQPFARLIGSHTAAAYGDQRHRAEGGGIQLARLDSRQRHGPSASKRSQHLIQPTTPVYPVREHAVTMAGGSSWSLVLADQRQKRRRLLHEHSQQNPSRSHLGHFPRCVDGI